MFDALPNVEDGKHTLEDSYHVGTVIFNNDPARQQRVKATVPGYLTDTNQANLPWIGPVAQSDFGNSSGFGSVKVPVIGSLIIIKFQGGDRNHGVYEGYACTAAMGQAMPAQLSTNYPNRYGYWDPKGNITFTDLTTGEMYLKHSSGTTIDIASNGTVTGTIVGSLNATVSGNTNLTTLGNLNLSVSGNLSLGVSGTIYSSAAMWYHSGRFQATEVQNAVGIVLGTHRHETYGTFSPTSPSIV